MGEVRLEREVLVSSFNNFVRKLYDLL